MSQPDSGRSRRRVLPIVDARFQWKYTLIITGLGVGITAIMGALLYQRHQDNTRLLDLGGDAALQEQVMRGDQIFLLYLIVLVVVIGLALGFWGLVVTHRISGPLYLVERYLTELAEGRYPDVRPLRKRDELQGFFRAFDEAITTLAKRDLAYLRDIDDALSEAKKTAATSPELALGNLVNLLQRQRDTLADATSQHRVD